MSFADAFQTYINNPEICKKITLYNDDTVIIIKDMFPKSLRHYLVIPKSPAVTHAHPLKVFNDNVKLYDILEDYVQLTKQYITDDLVKFGLLEDDPETIKQFKQTFIQCGVHSIPSLNNLHIHVMTRDFNSPRLKHKKHFNSFNTRFFVDFEDLNPIGENNNTEYSDSNSENLPDTEYSSGSDDSRTEISNYKFEMNPKKLHDLVKSTPLKCCYCGQSFGNSFSQLKKHLTVEFAKKFDTSKDITCNGMT
ncbi:aprataxin-like protein [Yamadazyma tenuis]|uniref:HIT-like protein n=1 Tax=Candida tenuis (strain ATCC 10573 / BCRC 21748 / CBS 615 / JCM 9827 / NBRC 10315 / NRRL Y-1498 / VKM Y-70) TaxID=590646 RepID=G3BEV8_CANTC|nr:HIT-like protein [Yamadazyma tenuis ATCC 10573]EGV60605.1 HIT-like protein [Yamadazyma tenuis ATCC 10573]WEJ94146.1 aprataxin-like protein [Yamadazyma tenuis]